MIGGMNALDIAIKNAGGVGKLAAAIGVGQPVVSNWRARGTTPDAVHCVAIERATSGVVTRQALRPEDWHLIWPELLAGAGAEAVTQEPAHG